MVDNNDDRYIFTAKNLINNRKIQVKYSNNKSVISPRMKLGHLTTYYILRLLKIIFSSLEPSSRHSISIYLANKMFFSKRLRSEQAFKNIRRAFPTWPKEKILSTLKECYIFFTSNLIEFISTPKSWESIEINVTGEKVLNEALKKNR